MSNSTEVSRYGALTIDASNNVTIATKGCPLVVFEVLTSSSLTVTVQAHFGSGTYRNVRSFVVSSTSTETQLDPGTTSGTLAAQDVILVPTYGAQAVRIVRQAGSGTVGTTAYPENGLNAGLLMKLIDGGITASTNTEYADDAAFTVATSKVTAIGAMADETTPDSVDEGDVGIPRMTLDRRIRVETTRGTLTQPKITSYSTAKIDLAASTANQVLVAAGGANTQIWVYGLFMMADTAAGTVTIQDEDDTALSGTMAVSDEGGWALTPSGNFAMPWIKVATNKALEADTGACTVDGIITYAVVDVS